MKQIGTGLEKEIAKGDDVIIRELSVMGSFDTEPSPLESELVSPKAKNSQFSLKDKRNLFSKLCEYEGNWVRVQQDLNQWTSSKLKEETTKMIKLAFKKMTKLLNKAISIQDINSFESDLLLRFLQQVISDKQISHLGKTINLITFIRDFIFDSMAKLQQSKTELDLSLIDFFLSKLVCHQQDKQIRVKKIRKARQYQYNKEDKSLKYRKMLKSSLNSMKDIIKGIQLKQKEDYNRHELEFYLTKSINSILDMDFALQYLRKKKMDNELCKEFTQVFMQFFISMSQLENKKYTDLVRNIDTLFDQSDNEDN